MCSLFALLGVEDYCGEAGTSCTHAYTPIKAEMILYNLPQVVEHKSIRTVPVLCQ